MFVCLTILLHWLAGVTTSDCFLLVIGLLAVVTPVGVNPIRSIFYRTNFEKPFTSRTLRFH